LLFKSGGAANAEIPIRANIAANQIASFRVRGWRAIFVAWPLSSLIFGAICSDRTNAELRI
jgi:hypothetical protein